MRKIQLQICQRNNTFIIVKFLQADLFLRPNTTQSIICVFQKTQSLSRGYTSQQRDIHNTTLSKQQTFLPTTLITIHVT